MVVKESVVELWAPSFPTLTFIFLNRPFVSNNDCFSPAPFYFYFWGDREKKIVPKYHREELGIQMRAFFLLSHLTYDMSSGKRG